MSTPQEKSPTPHSKPPAPASISPTPQSTPPKIGPSLRQAPTAKKYQANGFSVSNSPQQAQKHSQQSSILKRRLPVGARLRRAREAHSASRAIHSREAYPTPCPFHLRGARTTAKPQLGHRYSAGKRHRSVYSLHLFQFSISAPILSRFPPRHVFHFPRILIRSLFTEPLRGQAGQLLRLERSRISNSNIRFAEKRSSPCKEAA